MGALTEDRLLMLLANVFEAERRGADRVALDVVSVRALIADYNSFALQLAELKKDYSPEREANRIKTLEARIDLAAAVLRGHADLPLRRAAARILFLMDTAGPDSPEWIKALSESRSCL